MGSPRIGIRDLGSIGVESPRARYRAHRGSPVLVPPFMCTVKVLAPLLESNPAPVSIFQLKSQSASLGLDW